MTTTIAPPSSSAFSSSFRTNTTTTQAIPSCTVDIDCQNASHAGSCPFFQSLICRGGTCGCSPDQPTAIDTILATTTMQQSSTVPTVPTATVSPLSIGLQNCDDQNPFNDVGRVDAGYLDSVVSEACARPEQIPMGISATSNPFLPDGVFKIQNPDSEVWYIVHVTWVEGCTTIADSQDAWQPLPDRPDLDCRTLLNGNHNGCIGRGIGGSILAGCLEYKVNISLEAD
ncbi:putative Peptidase S8/S53 domain-containing protein [Seiridium cardinale]